MFATQRPSPVISGTCRSGCLYLPVLIVNNRREERGEGRGERGERGEGRGERGERGERGGGRGEEKTIPPSWPKPNI